MAMEVKTMEIKKPQPISSSTSSRDTSAGTWKWREFISDVKAEFKKITWTTPEELRTYTKIVVAATFIMGMAIYIMDLLIRACLNGLDVIMRFIGG
jgi:preprotein translocase subunit SecE